MQQVPACFVMICTNRTEKECLERNLFGDRDWRLPYLKSIKIGDVGFLLNVSKFHLLGVFVAESLAQLNIDPLAWAGQFPAQIKVKPIGELQKIIAQREDLEKIIEFREISKSATPYKLPSKNTYGPEITSKILTLFKNVDYKKISPSAETDIGVRPEFSLSDVAGLKDVKEFIYQRIIAPYEDQERAFSLGLRIGGGMLLFGPPGTGKTLIAMSVARDIEAKFIDISPSVIVGYPGEAEKRLETTFARLEKEPRAVVFLDEAEWILCRREDQTSSVMQRITPVLLAQLSRLFKQKTKPVIVIAATNKPEMIDPAFLRPGRFDKLFYIGLPNKRSREEIIKLQIKNRKNALSESDIFSIAEKLNGCSGADIENIIEESAFMAFNRKKDSIIQLSKEDIFFIINKTAKSVTAEEVERFDEFAKKRGLLNEEQGEKREIEKTIARTSDRTIEISNEVYSFGKWNEIPIIIAEWILKLKGSLPKIDNFVQSREEDFNMKSKYLKVLSNKWFIEVGDDKEALIKKGSKLLKYAGINQEFRINNKNEQSRIVKIE